MVPVNFVAVVLWETRNEVDAPGQHIRRQMALHIPFEAFRILRLLFYGKVQFATSVRSINRQYHSVTAMLVKRFNASYTASKGALEEAWKMFIAPARRVFLMQKQGKDSRPVPPALRSLRRPGREGRDNPYDPCPSVAESVGGQGTTVD